MELWRSPACFETAAIPGQLSIIWCHLWFLELPISRTNLHFPWMFEKSGFPCYLVDPWCPHIPVPDRLFIPSLCHNFGCVLWSSWWTLISTNCKTVAFQQRHQRASSAQRRLCHSIQRSQGNKQNFATVADENILANMHVDHGQVGQKILLFTTRVETLVPHKHVIAKLPLVPLWIIKLTHLTAGVCMKVRLCSSRKYPYSAHRRHWNSLGGGRFCKAKKSKEMYEA